jgi:hypothetical protein
MEPLCPQISATVIEIIFFYSQPLSGAYFGFRRLALSGYGPQGFVSAALGSSVLHQISSLVLLSPFGKHLQ